MQLHPKTECTLYELGACEFPMLCAFRTLTNSLSCTPQSAPGCTAEFSAEQWGDIEAALRVLSAQEFVVLALGPEDTEQGNLQEQLLWDRPAFRVWQGCWE